MDRKEITLRGNDIIGKLWLKWILALMYSIFQSSLSGISHIRNYFNMGNKVTTVYASDVDEKYMPKISNDMDNIKSDAIGRAEPYTNRKEFYARPQFDIDNLERNESFLDIYDKTSLIFLLYDNPDIALQDCLLIRDRSIKKVIWGWCQYESKKNPRWREKLLEAFSIIQHFRFIKELGHCKEECISVYLPFQIEAALHISKVKKGLFRMFEELSEEETKQLLDFVKSDLEKCNKKFRDFNDNLEVYFLYWETIKYIDFNDLTNILRIVKNLRKEVYYSFFEKLSQGRTTSNIRVVDQKQATESETNHRNILKIDKTENESLTSTNSLLSTLNSDPTKIYDINKKYPGYCLVINQEVFYQEFEEELKKELLAPIDMEARTGSEFDVRALKDTFGEYCGMKIVVQNNLTDGQIYNELENGVKEVEKYSSFFVIILSHGEEGVVYGCNSVGVRINSIVEKMCLVENKPKVLIIQACRGRKVLPPVDNIQTDGPVQNHVIFDPAEIMIINSTVQNYAALRDITNGSWFIQILCEKIKENKHCLHLADIITEVQAELKTKRCRKGRQVATHENRFTKYFYFP